MVRNKIFLRALLAALSCGLLAAAAGRGAAPQDSRPPANWAQSLPTPEAERREQDVHRLIGILDYVAADYGGAVRDGVVASAAEYEEQCSLAAEALELATELAAGENADFLAPLASLARAIEGKAPEAAVQEPMRAARKLVLARFDVRLSPSAPPNLRNGERLYRQNCALCHGEDGRAETPRAGELNPRPLSYHSEKGRTVLSPYHVFNTMTFGVSGTAMASFSLLPAHDRWDVAFYVLSLRHAAPPKPPEGLPPLSLAELANSTDAALAARLAELGRPADARDAELAWLRREPAPPGAGTERGFLPRGRRALAEALDLAREGKREEAARCVLDVYLKDLEPVEAPLRASDPGLVARIESGFVGLRAELRGGAPTASLARRVEELDRELATAETQLSSRASAPWVTFLASALILLREGIEAALLVAALLGLLRKLGKPRAARSVHAGWIAALVAGLATWGVARAAIQVTAAERELVEGVVGLLAAVVLAYTSYWVLSRADSRRWLEFLRGQVEGALAGRGRFALFGIAFLAAYREAFETVLFYEALASERGAEAAGPILLGVAAGSLGLLLAIVAIFKLARRLPLRSFFTISGGLLYVLAFVFAGTGIHALVEGGYLEPRPVRFPRIEWLGVYPDAIGLALQALFVAAVAAGLLLDLRSRRAAVAAL